MIANDAKEKIMALDGVATPPSIWFGIRRGTQHDCEEAKQNWELFDVGTGPDLSLLQCLAQLCTTTASQTHRSFSCRAEGQTIVALRIRQTFAAPSGFRRWAIYFVSVRRPALVLRYTGSYAKRSARCSER